MFKRFGTVAMATLAALAFSAAIVSSPAEASQFHGGGGGHWGGGGGGHWGGGGGGGHRGGGGGGGGHWGGGWNGGGGWYGGWADPYWGYGWDSGPDYGYPPSNSCWVYRDVYDAHGRYLGHRQVNLCD